MSPQKKRHLDLQYAQKASKRYSSRIRFLRYLTPTIAVCVFLGLFLWPYLEETLYTPTSEEKEFVQETAVQNRIIKPKLNAFDDQGQPYRLTAETAHQKEESKADLETPEGQIILKDGTVVQISSKTGHYDKDHQSLDYNKDVHLKTSNGYHLKTEAAHINFKDHYAEGKNPLSGKGPAGTIASQKGFIIEEDTMHLLGPSRLVITQNKKKP